MRTYRTVFKETEHFFVDVEASSMEEAMRKSQDLFNQGAYIDTGNHSVDLVHTVVK